MPQLNEDSFKPLDHVINKNYYLHLDAENRLTLELTEDKSLQECIGITVNTINTINSQTPKAKGEA